MNYFKKEYKGFYVSDGPTGLWLYLESTRLDDCIAFMKSENIFSMTLNYMHGFVANDLMCLEKFDFVKRINIVNSIKDISPIYHLKNLETLILQTEDNNPVDFSRFPNIKEIAFDWRQKSDSLYNCTNLEELRIWSYKSSTNDLTKFSNLKNLKKLKMVTSSIQSLQGIEKLQNLESLELSYFSKLTDIEPVKYLKNLTNLTFTSCKAIQSFEPISNLTQLKRLVFDKMGDMPTVKTFSMLVNLEQLGWHEKTTVTDGDLTPLFNLKKLKRFHITRRKHYSHTTDEIMEKIKGE